MPDITRLICLVILWSPLAIVAQSKPAQAPRRAPHFTGDLVTTNGARRLTLQTKHDSKSETFTGILQSPCMAPSQVGSGGGKPLNLSTIPVGTRMTVFYVRHGRKGDAARPPENVILAIRLDRVSGRDSSLPQGIFIPCFEPARQSGK